MAWIAKNQLGRRNRNAFQRAELALACEPDLKKKAKERQKKGLKQGQAPVGRLSDQREKHPRVNDQLAEIANTGHDAIHMTRVIKKNAAPEDIEKARRGEIVEVKLKDRAAVLAYMARKRLGRSNLTDAQRIKLALLLEPELEAKAKENQKTGGNDSKVGRTKLSNPITTRKEIAKAAGTSEGTVHKAKIIFDEGSPELIEDVLSGEKSINAPTACKSLDGSAKPPWQSP